MMLSGLSGHFVQSTHHIYIYQLVKWYEIVEPLSWLFRVSCVWEENERSEREGWCLEWPLAMDWIDPQLSLGYWVCKQWQKGPVIMESDRLSCNNGLAHDTDGFDYESSLCEIDIQRLYFWHILMIPSACVKSNVFNGPSLFAWHSTSKFIRFMPKQIKRNVHTHTQRLSININRNFLIRMVWCVTRYPRQFCPKWGK